MLDDVANRVPHRPPVSRASPCPATRSWLLHGITIVAAADAECYLDALEAALRLPRAADAPAGESLAVVIHTESTPTVPAWDRQGVTLWARGSYRLCRIDDDPAVRYGATAWSRFSTVERRITITGPSALIAEPFTLTQLLFMPLLAPALRCWGLLPLHACAVDWHGRALLFPAPSGSGKSTLALALLRGGYRLISDDMPILQRQADGTFLVLPFPERSRVRPDSLAFFPELSHVRGQVPQSGDKVLLDPVAIFGDCYAVASAPRAIVLPRIANVATSTVQSIAPSTALAALISGLAFGATGEAMGAILPALCDFVASCRTWSLDTGTDFDELPALLRPLLEAA